MLNIQRTPFKLENETSGNLLIHNTTVTVGSPFSISTDRVFDTITRNNIFVGTHGMGIGGPSTQIRCDFDNDGFAWRANDASANQEFGSYFAVWNERQIKALDQPRPKEGLYDRYGAVVLEPKTLFAAQPPFLGARGALYNVGSNDLRLDSASLAIDQGVLLPNFNDRYIGSGPDLGCCEEGEATPQYGPRPPAH